MENRIKAIKEHFEKEAAVFDTLFFKVMPRYEEMMQALIDALPFRSKDKIKILDLGCGTGNLSQKLLLAYPNARISCVDMAENMLKMAKAKLKGSRNVLFWQGDVRDLSCREKYDCIVSSMVLHHVEGREKPRLYRKLRNCLPKGGVFLCVDIFLSSNRHLQELYMDKWKEFMRANGLPEKKVNNMLRRHQKEDRPVVFTEELEILRRAGFKEVDVILKHYNFAVYGGMK